jgi:hypothetical protein
MAAMNTKAEMALNDFVAKYDAFIMRCAEFEASGQWDVEKRGVMSAYFESLTTGVPAPIDVYDAAAYMCVTVLSEQSIALGGMPVAVPDFTRGKWYMTKETPDSKFKLNK